MPTKSKGFAAHDINRTLEYQPSRHKTLADIEDKLAWAEIPRGTAGKALCHIDLGDGKHGKYLMTAGLDQTHRLLLRNHAVSIP